MIKRLAALGVVALVIFVIGWIARLEPDTPTLVGALVLLVAVTLYWRRRRP